MKVYNLKFSVPTDIVSIDRSTKWGNPFRIGQSYRGKILTRKEAISSHKNWLLYSDGGLNLLLNIWELKNKNLGGWCKPLDCHGDLLFYLANSLNISPGCTIEKLVEKIKEVIKDEYNN